MRGVRERRPAISPRAWWYRQAPWVHGSAAVAAVAVAAFVPLTLSTYWQGVLFFPVGIYVLLAIGLNIVVGYAGLLDLGYVAFYAVGAYTTAKLTTTFGLDPWFVVVPSIALAMVAGLILGTPTLRLRGDYLAIVTLGFGEIVRIIAVNTDALGETRGIVGIPHPSLPGIEFGLHPLPYYELTLAAIVLAIVMTRRLRLSRVGRSWEAVREDEDAAELMGVPTFVMKLWAFAIGASTGGLAGFLYASKVSFIDPNNFQLFLSILILSAVVLGGQGTTPGAMAGAFAVAFLPEYLRRVPIGDTVTGWLNAVIGSNVINVTEFRVMFFGLALVIMMVFRPAGIIPRRVQRRPRLWGRERVAIAGEEVGRDGHSVLEDRPAAALTITKLTIRFGGVTAVNEVDLNVEPGSIFGIIGPNGAGKTTMFNCITGVYRPTAGDIRLDGRSLVRRKPHGIVAEGVCRTFQNIRLFPDLTAEDNVLVGADAQHRTSVPGALVGSPRHRREERDGLVVAAELLEFVGIGDRAGEAARNLSYGDQRRLELARALATRPRLLLLDEPAAGMNPSEKSALIELIRKVRDRGPTVVLIEHDMGLVMRVCERIAVLDFGEKIAEGTPSEIQRDARVIEAYLGVVGE